MRYQSRFGPIVFAIAAALLLAVAGCGGPGSQAKEIEKNASALLEQGKIEEAVAEYSRAIELDPRSDLAYQGRANAYREMKDFYKALADLDKAIEIAPQRGGLYYDRGLTHQLRGSIDLAIADFTRAIGDMSKTRWRSALYQRGLAYEQKGDPASARADFEKIVQLEKDYPGEGGGQWLQLAQAELDKLRQ